MKIFRVKTCFSALVLLIAAICMVLPVTAANGTVTITYRGYGGMYIGDTVYFDGTNTAGNTTLLKITGPGLPSEGVPLFDLNGAPGSGNTASVNADGKWTFRWDSPRDSPKLQTAKYTIIASDYADPEKTSTVSILLKKPEFYITISPASARIGDYIQVQGVAEKSISYIKLNVTDASGTVFHTYMAPVSTSGSFEYSFHADMQPGQYKVIGTNPAMKNNLEIVLTVVGPQTQTTAPQATASEPTVQQTTSLTVAPTQAEVTLQATPSQTGIAPATILIAVIIFGAVAVLRTGSRKK